MRVCYRVDVIAEPNVGDLKTVFDVWFSFSEWRNIRGDIFRPNGTYVDSVCRRARMAESHGARPYCKPLSYELLST